MDGNNQQVIRSSVAVFVQIDFIDAEGKTHYIEPFSKNAQGARMESRFFRTPVGATATQQPTFDPASLMGTQQQTAQQQQPAPQQPGMAAAPVPPAPGTQTPGVPNGNAPF